MIVDEVLAGGYRYADQRLVDNDPLTLLIRAEEGDEEASAYPDTFTVMFSEGDQSGQQERTHKR